MIHMWKSNSVMTQFPLVQFHSLNMTGKLQSLQGLRGVAILLVLAFHIYPKWLKQCFVGVDIFFALSGFLMTKILSNRNEGKLNLKIISEFYQKRFKRILPLYYLTILVTIFSVLIFVIKNRRDDFIWDVEWSIPLVLNFQPIFEHHTYWQQLSSIRFLTHLWSLCVEIQYYIMAPIIFFIASKMSYSHRIFSYLLAICILFGFQVLTPFELSYAFLAARIWQFLVGAVAFELSERFLVDPDGKDNSDIKYHASLYAIFLLMGLIISFPGILFNEHSTRLIFTILSGVICMLSRRIENTVLSFKPLVFFGNISYTIYLIHWPVINLVRYIQKRDVSDITIQEIVMTLTIVFLFSIVTHYTIEEYFINTTFLNCLIVVILTAFVSLGSIHVLKNQECVMAYTLPEDLAPKFHWNNDLKNLIKEPWTLPCQVYEMSSSNPASDFCLHKSNGTGKILIIGNSVSIRAFPYLFELFNGSYSEIRMFSKHGGAPLLNIFPEYTDACVEMIKTFQPDLLWIIQGVHELVHLDRKFEDGIYQKVLDRMRTIPKRIYIDLPYFVPSINVVDLISRNMIYRHDNYEMFAFSREIVESFLHDFKSRLLNLNCSNCEFLDIQGQLMINDTFYAYEKETLRPIIYDGAHFSLTAFEHLRELYLEKIQKFYDL